MRCGGHHVVVCRGLAAIGDRCLLARPVPAMNTCRFTCRVLMGDAFRPLTSHASPRASLTCVLQNCVPALQLSACRRGRCIRSTEGLRAVSEHHAAVPERLEYLEKLVGDSADKHWREIQAAAACIRLGLFISTCRSRLQSFRQALRL